MTMTTTATYDMERPIGSDRHVWIDMGCLCGKVNVSYRIEGCEAQEIANIEAAVFLGSIAQDLLLVIATAHENFDQEIPDITEGVVVMGGRTIILRYEVVGADIPVPSMSVN